MIVVRDTFQVKFGKAQDAISAWKQGHTLIKKIDGNGKEWRLLTDMAGSNFYTLVMESEFESLADYEATLARIMGNQEWKSWYQKFVPLAESGRREILKVVQ